METGFIQTSPRSAESPAATETLVARGRAYAFFAYDIGFGIDLPRAERCITTDAQREQLRQRRRAPSWFQFEPAPLRIAQPAAEIAVGPRRTAPQVEIVLYDFGAVSVTYTLEFSGPLDGLLALSQELYDHGGLAADSRRRVEALLGALGECVVKPCLADVVEDYVVFQIEALAAPCTGAEFARRHASLLARMLRCEDGALSQDEIDDVHSVQISYAPGDLTIIDWNAALVLADEAEDVRSVLEFANVQLLEMRFLDRQLDAAMDEAFRALSESSRWRLLWARARGAELRRVARLQADSAQLFEAVNNALKLLGDQYLARVYQQALRRLHLPEWDAVVTRKLASVDNIYGKLADELATRRMELLEWIIIVLIFVSIVLALPGK